MGTRVPGNTVVPPITSGSRDTTEVLTASNLLRAAAGCKLVRRRRRAQPGRASPPTEVIVASASGPSIQSWGTNATPWAGACLVRASFHHFQCIGGPHWPTGKIATGDAAHEKAEPDTAHQPRNPHPPRSRRHGEGRGRGNRSACMHQHLLAAFVRAYLPVEAAFACPFPPASAGVASFSGAKEPR